MSNKQDVMFCQISRKCPLDIRNIFAMRQNVTKVHVFIALSIAFTILYAVYNYSQYWIPGYHEERIRVIAVPPNNKTYLVYTPGCKIPKFDPFDPTVKEFYMKTSYSYKCSSTRSVFTLLDNGGVSLREDILLKQYRVKKNDTSCYYHPVTRDVHTKKPDTHFLVGKRHELVYKEPIIQDYVVVKCFKANRIIFSEILALTPIKPLLEEECEKKRSTSKAVSEDLNVIVAGIDSVSKLNFLRYFQQTEKFLRNNLSAFELHGYNKVADNTYPNLIPFLTGHQRDYYNYKEKKFEFFDDVDFVWKEFSSAGYRTLFAEDTPKIGTFVLNRRGFNSSPTDYYGRPLSMVMEDSKFRNNYYCVGPRLELGFYFDYLQRFAKAMGDRLFFAFVFIARLTHDLLTKAGFADKPSFELLRELDRSNALNKSMLVFFSDHGIRFGGIRKTYIGKIEERMPFMFLVFPDWFLHRYPNYAVNLKTNQRRLVSPYDIHATFRHLLHLNNSKFYTQYGQSLLTEISPHRTCADAMILPHWCVCQSHTLVSNDDAGVKTAGNAVVQKLNEILTPFSNSCVEFVLQHILDARLSKPNEDMLGKDVKLKMDFVDYLVTIRVLPSHAIFEATVHLRKGIYTVSEEISRINLYSNQSHCIQDSIIRKYCFCKDLLGVA